MILIILSYAKYNTRDAAVRWSNKSDTKRSLLFRPIHDKAFLENWTQFYFYLFLFVLLDQVAVLLMLYKIVICFLALLKFARVFFALIRGFAL